jgi:predicted N-acyltransferase
MHCDTREALELAGEAEQESAAEISIEQCRRIAEIDAKEWDRVAGESVLASHGLLSTIEETRAISHASRYFLARRNGQLVGAVICHLEEGSNPEGAVPIGGHRLDKMMLGRLAKLGRYSGTLSLPCLMCGTQIGTRDPLIVRPGISEPEKTRIAEALVEAIDRAARRERWTVCFRQVNRAGSPLEPILTERGYLRGAELPTACLELEPQWTAFDGYRQHLKKVHPSTAKTIGNETNRAKKTGLVIERIDEPGPHREELHGLINRHELQHNSRPWPFRAEFFEKLKTRLGDGAAFYSARWTENWWACPWSSKAGVTSSAV